MTHQISIKERLKKAQLAADARRLSEASNILEQLIEEDPSILQAWDLLGFVRYFQNRFVEAHECCVKALAIKPDNPYALKGMGLCLVRLDRREEGLKYLKQAIDLAPNWRDPYWDLAVTFIENKQYNEAIAIIAQAEKQNSNWDFKVLKKRCSVKGRLSAKLLRYVN